MDQREILQHVLGTLERLAIPHMVVGSFAAYAYGEPRFTQDIDIVLDLPPFAVGLFCAAFPAPEFYVSADAVRDAVRDRFQFNVLHPSTCCTPHLRYSQNQRRNSGSRIHPTMGGSPRSYGDLE